MRRCKSRVRILKQFRLTGCYGCTYDCGCCDCLSLMKRLLSERADGLVPHQTSTPMQVNNGRARAFQTCRQKKINHNAKLMFVSDPSALLVSNHSHASEKRPPLGLPMPKRFKKNRGFYIESLRAEQIRAAERPAAMHPLGTLRTRVGRDNQFNVV